MGVDRHDLSAALVSVQRLLGHSDPKITERRYGHLLPDFMASEVTPAAVRAGPACAALGPLTPTPPPALRGERERFR
jgi:hypothetical protein